YLPCVLRACFSLLSRCSAALRAVHSFPTRRSSDLLVLPLGEGAAQLGVARLLEVHRAPSFRATLSARAPGQGRKRQREQQCTARSEEHTSELQSRVDLVCRLLLAKRKSRRVGAC